MGKVMILVFTLTLNFTLLGIVLGQDDPWKSMLDQASKAGISQDAFNKAFGGLTANKGAGDSLGDGGNSLGDWVQQVDIITRSTSPASSPSDSTLDIDADVDDTFANGPRASSTLNAPRRAPTGAAPVSAPKASPRAAPKPSPTKAPELSPPQYPQYPRST